MCGPVFVCMLMRMYAYMCVCLWSPEEDNESPEVEVTNGLKQPVSAGKWRPL